MMVSDTFARTITLTNKLIFNMLEAKVILSQKQHTKFFPLAWLQNAQTSEKSYISLYITQIHILNTLANGDALGFL